MPKSIEYMQDNNLSEKHAKCLNWEKLLRRHNSDGLINYLILLALDSMSSAPALRDLRLASPSSDRIRISGCFAKEIMVDPRLPFETRTILSWHPNFY
jgi:hypothetical protein